MNRCSLQISDLLLQARKEDSDGVSHVSQIAIIVSSAYFYKKIIGPKSWSKSGVFSDKRKRDLCSIMCLV